MTKAQILEEALQLDLEDRIDLVDSLRSTFDDRDAADRARLAAAVHEAERDVAAGRVVAHEEMKRRWLLANGQS